MALESTSVPTEALNMAENHGLTDDSTTTELLQLLQLPTASCLLYLERSELGTIMTQQEVDIPTKVKYRQLYQNLRSQLRQAQSVSLARTSTTSIPSSTFTSSTKSTVTSTLPLTHADTLNDKITNLSFWGIKPTTTTIASTTHTTTSPTTSHTQLLTSISNLRLPDGREFLGFKDGRAINYVIMVARQECRQNALSAHGCYLYLCRCLGQGPKLKLMDHLERALPPEAFMSNYELMFTTALEFLQAHFATTNDHDRITRHLSAIKMASKSVSVHDYLDTLESSISMANSVGLYLHASQVLDYFKRGLTPHLRKVCNQQYSNIRDVTELAMALQYYQEANPPPTTAITTPTATTTSTTTSNSTTSTSSVAPIQSTNPTTTRLQRIEDPEVIKLCKEKRICMAYLARQSCKNGDSCPYKHTTEVSRMTAPTTPTTTPNADSVTILNCPACEGFTIVPDTGSTMSLISKKLADFIVKTVEGAQLLSFHATFDSATEAKSFSCDYCLQVDLPVYDGNATHILPWRPAVLQTPLIHSDALLGMDALRFDRQGLLLRFKDGEDALASLFFRSVPPQISTGSVPSSLSPVTCELPRSNSAASPSETSHSPIPTTSTTPLPTASVAPPCELLPPASTTAPNNAVKIKRKGDVDYNVKEALTTPPTFPPLDDGFVIDQHVYSNQWCRILTIKDEDNNKQFMVDYSNELLQLALQNQPPEATKVHYRLLKSDGRVRREAEARFDDLLNTNKVVATPAHSVNNYASPWYPVEGRKRCRPVVPSICSNQLLRQVQRHYPIRDCQSKISRILNKYRSAKTASLLDVKDSYRSIRLGKNAQLLSQVHVRGSTLTYLYMLDGSSINAKVLEWCVNHVLRELHKLPGFEHVAVSYMDDVLVLYFTDTDPNHDLQTVINHFAEYNMILVAEPLHGPASNGTTILGSMIVDNGDSIIFPTAKYEKCTNYDLTKPTTYSSALSFLGQLSQAWDLFGWHILPCKNALTALVSRARAVHKALWKKTVIDDSTLQLLVRWQELVRSTPPLPLRRHIDPSIPVTIWFDASDQMGAMVAEQNGCIIFRHQWPWSRQERSLHINVRELTTAYNALCILVNYEVDTRQQFKSILLRGDNKTANAALSSAKVASNGKQSVLLQRIIDLIHYLMKSRRFDVEFTPTELNKADAGTRSELYVDIVTARDTLDSYTVQPLPITDDSQQVHVARIVRKRDDDSNNASLPQKKTRLEEPIEVPLQPLPTAPTTPYDTVQLPADLLQVYRSLPLSDDGNLRLTADHDFLVSCAKHLHSLRHGGAPEITTTLRSYFATTGIDIDDIARTASRDCMACLMTKTNPGDNRPKNPTADVVNIPDFAFQVVNLDVLGPYVTDPATRQGKFYSINLVDQLTNILLCYPTVKAPTSVDIQRACNLPHRLYNHAIQNIRTDNASTIHVASKAMVSVDFQFVPRSASWMNGHVEARHRLLNQRLRRMFMTTPFVDDDKWRESISRAAYEINTTTNMLANGLCPLDMITESHTSPFDNNNVVQLPSTKWDTWRNYKTDCRLRVLRLMQKHNSHSYEISVGDLVLVRAPDLQPKASPPWLGQVHVVSEVEGNRILLENGTWHSSDKLKKLPDEILPRGPAGICTSPLLLLCSSKS